MKLSSIQEKERRNIIIFCTTILLGYILEININDLTILGQNLCEIPVLKAKIAGYIVLVYFLFTHSTMILSIDAGDYKESATGILKEIKAMHNTQFNPTAQENMPFRTEKSINEEIKEKIKKKNPRMEKRAKTHEKLEYFQLLILPYLLITLTFIVIFINK